MKRSVFLWEIFGFAFTALLGTILHFLYEWLGEAAFIAPFSGVNESTWEHMKLLFWPMLIYAVAQSFIFEGYKNFWCVKLRGMLLGLFTIPLIFYLYNGVIGESPDFVNIAIFFVSAAVAYLYEVRLFAADALKECSKRRAVIAICAIAFLFVLFTFKAPEIAIFRDPITGAYGI